MCVPYASDSGGTPVGGLGGIAGSNAELFRGIVGTNMNVLPGLTGTPGTGGTPPPAPAGNWSELAFPSPGGPGAGISAPAYPGKPETAALPKTVPASAPPAPAAPAVGNPAAVTPPKLGFDPLPQTSGEHWNLAFTGHESLSPHWAQRMAGAPGRGGGGGSGPAAVPTPPARPETAAVPGTEPVAYTGPTAGATVLSGGSANAGTPSVNGLPNVAVVERYIRTKAAALGIDPDVAVAVAKSEGLSPGTWQSNIAGGGGPGNREPSFGPFQLHDKYMGADFTRATGLRASDPSTWQAQVDFVLGRVPTTGWGPFHGAAATGIGDRQGLPAGVRGAGPSDVAANGAPLIEFGTAGAAGAVGPEGPAGASSDVVSGSSSTAALPGSRGEDTLSGPSRIQYVNQNSIRNKPLSPKLASLLDQATAEEGVTTRVISGGQDATGERRTGSHRHDEDAPGAGGNAGDVQFIKDGRALDMTNPADLQIIIRILSRVYGGGAQGIGASPAYMGSRTFHVGFGNPAVWGAGGQGAEAPPWLRQIAASGGTPPTGGTAVAGGTAPATPGAAPAGGSGILAALTGMGGGGGGGRAPAASNMNSRIEEFLQADAARRLKLRNSLPPIGELSIQPQHIQNQDWDVASLASIIGAS